jgi:hypothetical protein
MKAYHGRKQVEMWHQHNPMNYNIHMDVLSLLVDKKYIIN